MRVTNEKISSEQNKPVKITTTPGKYFQSDENGLGPVSETKERPVEKGMDTAIPAPAPETPISQERIYPDLQITATPEIPQTQVYQGTERLPKTSTEKTATPAQTEKVSAPDTNQTSTIGKVSFLKQYAADLKMQIEKNKDNANYPLAEKQKELSDLEHLLKGE